MVQPALVATLVLGLAAATASAHPGHDHDHAAAPAKAEKAAKADKPAKGETHGHAAPGDPASMAMMWEKSMTPGPCHAKLDSMVGTWAMKTTMWMDPTQPPMVAEGTSETRWTLGKLFVEQTAKSEVDGMPFEGRGLFGHDNVTDTYVSTWIDNMGTGIMTSESVGDHSGNVIRFQGEMTDPMAGGRVPVSETFTFVDADHHRFEMFTKGDDGKEQRILQVDYTRKK